MKILFFFLLLVLSEASLGKESEETSLTLRSDEDNKCAQLDWTKEQSRIQGGGWFWFPGKAVAVSLEKSYELSEGMALARLKQECQSIPKDTKFHERCDYSNGKFHISYVRASVKDKDCSRTATQREDQTLINKELLVQYQKFTENQKFTQTLGDKPENEARLLPEDMINLATYSWFIGNKEKAINLMLSTSKRFHEVYKYVGIQIYEIGEKEFGRAIVERMCLEGSVKHCFFFALFVFNENGKKFDELSVKGFAKACEGKEGEACVYIGKYYFDLNQKENSMPYLKKGCEFNDSTCCAILASEEKDPIEQEKLMIKSCDLGNGMICKMLGLKAAKADQHDKAGPLFEKGCAADFGGSCMLLGIHYMQFGKNEKAIASFEKACSLNEAEACQVIDKAKKDGAPSLPE